jgi:hypothetical protein
MFLNSWRVSSRIVRYDPNPPAIQKLNSTDPQGKLRLNLHSLIAFSLLALLVMNFDRYLTTSYPIFYRTWVTLFAILIFASLPSPDGCKRLFRSYEVGVLIFLLLSLPQWCSSSGNCSQLPGKDVECRRILILYAILPLLTVACFMVDAIDSSVCLPWAKKWAERERTYSE